MITAGARLYLIAPASLDRYLATDRKPGPKTRTARKRQTARLNVQLARRAEAA